MKVLVDNKKANKDYTHINLAGGKVLAQHFFNSIKAGYDNYVRRKAWETQQ